MSGGKVGMRQSVISLRIALLAVIFMFSVNLADAVQKTEWPNINTQDKKLLQYRVGSHMLGIAADKAYLVVMTKRSALSQENNFEIDSKHTCFNPLI
jgi:hypothetical protein